jgi:hypothetical protein
MVLDSLCILLMDTIYLSDPANALLIELKKYTMALIGTIHINIEGSIAAERRSIYKDREKRIRRDLVGKAEALRCSLLVH